ncbi:MAG: thiamine-phosphate synthase family protein [Thermoplasmata archaeon]
MNEVIPAIRAEIARTLNSKGISQHEIASRLGITQAMVSKYFSKPPVNPDLPYKEWAKEIEAAMRDEDPVISSTKQLCALCISYREKGCMCKAHSSSFSSQEFAGCTLCMNIRTDSKSKERIEIIQEMERAVALLSEADISVLFPQVRMNMVYCTSEAQSKNDVAGFPGRLTLVGTNIVYYKPPEFGASNHLSNILLRIRESSPNIRAAVNLRGGKVVSNLLELAGFSLPILTNTAFEKLFYGRKAAGKELSKGFMVEEDVGIEGALYLFGNSPVSLGMDILKILEQSNRGKHN